MTDPILPLLVVVLAALLGVATAGAFLPVSARHAIGFTATALSGIGCLLAFISVLAASDPVILDLPAGPPGLALHVALDPLSGYFLVFVLLAGTASLGFAAETPGIDPPATLAGAAAGLAGLGFTLLATDGAGIALGLAITGGALWATGEHSREPVAQATWDPARDPTGKPGHSRAIQLAVLLAAGALAMTAFMLLSTPPAPTPAGTAGAADSAALLLVLIGAGALGGLAPLHRWLVPSHAAAPARAAALLSGGVVPVAIYLLLRSVAVLAGRAPPLWWGLPILLMGAAAALLGPWRAAGETTIDRIAAASTHRSAGLAAIGIGLVLFGRAADLPNLAALAAAATLLLGASQALCGSLVVLAAGAVQHGAGSRRLDRLGGLSHRMPVAAAALAAGLFALCGPPPGTGFAAMWLLFQALLAAPRAGGLAQQALLAGLAGVLALSAALALAAAVRLFGVGFLGRARSPRSAAADDVPGRARPALLALASLAVLPGLLPGLVLWLLADPAIVLLAGTGLGARAGFLGLAPASDAPGYAVLPLTALGLLCIGVPWWLYRRYARPERSSPIWHDGFARPPAWLPFGDPVTQSDGSGFTPDLPPLPKPRRSFGWPAVVGSIAGPAAAIWTVLAVVALLLGAIMLWRPA